MMIGAALIVFLIVYLGWAFYDISKRYSKAVRLSERQAHTILGKEGYEYIFEPSTQVLIDKIKPNRAAILAYVFLKDYTPFQSGSECAYPDQDICHWMDIRMFYGHDPGPALRNMVLSASIIALLAAFATRALGLARGSL